MATQGIRTAVDLTAFVGRWVALASPSTIDVNTAPGTASQGALVRVESFAGVQWGQVDSGVDIHKLVTGGAYAAGDSLTNDAQGRSVLAVGPDAVLGLALEASTGADQLRKVFAFSGGLSTGGGGGGLVSLIAGAGGGISIANPAGPSPTIENELGTRAVDDVTLGAIAGTTTLQGAAVDLESATGDIQLVSDAGNILLDAAPSGTGNVEISASGIATFVGETNTTVTCNNGQVNVTAPLDDLTITSSVGDVVITAGGFVNLEGALGVALRSEPPHLGSFTVAGLAGAPGVGFANAFAVDARRLTAAGPYPTLEAAPGSGSMVERSAAGVWHLPGTLIVAVA